MIKNIEQKPFILGSIFVLSNKLQTLSNQIYKEISIKQWFLLAVISKFQESAPSLVQVSKIIGSSYQNVKKMALILEKKEFLNIIGDKNDKRILRLYMTEKCKNYFGATVEQEEQLTNDLFKDFDNNSLATLYYGISKLVSNIEQMEEKYYE